MMRRRQFFGAMAGWTAATAGLASHGLGAWPLALYPPLRDGWQSRSIAMRPRQGLDQPPVVTGVALQPNGSLLSVVGDDHVVSLLDLERDEFTGHYIRHQDWVRAARFTPDGKTLLTAGNDGRLVRWNLQAAGEALELARHPAAILNIAIDGGGRQVATVGFQAEVIVYDLSSGRTAASFRGPCNDLSAVAFSLDDSHLAAAGRTGTVCLWSLAAGTLEGEFQALKRRVRGLEFLSDGRLAACGHDGCIALFDPRDPSRTEVLPRHPAKLFALKRLEQDMLATCGSDNRIHLWDLAAARPLETLSGHIGTVTCLDYRAGVLVSGSYDTQIRIWESQRQALALPNTSPPASIWK